MNLNEVREWPQDLCVNGVDFNANFLKANKPQENKKQISAVQPKPDVSPAPKKPK